MRFPIDERDWKTIGSDKVSAIGLGTWAVRDWDAALKVLEAAIESGKVNLVDTAEMYSWGRAEEMVGRLVRRVGRDRVFITTKILPHHLLDPEEAVKAAKASLRRLGVREVDLFLIHWPLSGVPIRRQVRALERAVYEHGLARYIGVSNFDHRQLREAVHATRSAEIVVDQVDYSVFRKWPETSGLLDVALEHGVTLQAYSPLGRCRARRSYRLREIARRIGRTPIQVALNYVISRPGVIAVTKTENMAHLEEILGALGWRLPPRIIEELEEPGCC